jgi:hypothetical protein
VPSKAVKESDSPENVGSEQDITEKLKELNISGYGCGRKILELGSGVGNSKWSYKH